MRTTACDICMLLHGLALMRCRVYAPCKLTGAVVLIEGMVTDGNIMDHLMKDTRNNATETTIAMALRTDSSSIDLGRAMARLLHSHRRHRSRPNRHRMRL